MALAIPAAPNGLCQQDLAPTSSQLTWISDAFLVPVWYPGARKRPGTLP